jgi:hypothetical protein
MSADQMEVCMEWIASRLIAFAAAAGLDLQPIGSDASAEDFKRSRHRLAELINGTRQILTFADSDLEDLPGGRPMIQSRAGSRISCECSCGASARPFLTSRGSSRKRSVRAGEPSRNRRATRDLRTFKYAIP